MVLISPLCVTINYYKYQNITLMRRDKAIAYLVILFVVVTRSALMRCSFIVKPKDCVSVGNGSDNFDAIALIELIGK